MNKSSLLLELKDSALIIIDVQERLLPVVQEKDLLVDNIEKLVRFALLANMPLVLTEQQKLGPTVQDILRLVSSATAVSKITFDCFKTPEFVELVNGLQRKNLIICGIEAHICVLQTALHGLKTHRVHVVADAVSSRSKVNRDVALLRMQQAGVMGFEKCR